ncbi:MAG: pyridoxamine kinase [Selenomonadaceae bacterium]|nr:pyridoxamine kinase [Selenomonadaceae bacterium]MBR1858884.1 pyridoxamine kinase [Selenomonadaceae bacterium]
MNQKRIALINDITGFGRCSITVELPIISALKIQACPLPTAILSVHTGFESYFLDDYTDNMQLYIDSWNVNHLNFDGIATGFLGSETQIEIVNKFIEANQESFVMIDPVMGDHGRLYASYNKQMCRKMRELLIYADLVTPNLTEACELLGVAYPSNGKLSDSKLATMAANIASKTRGHKVVITGVTLDTDDGSNITNFVFDNGNINLITAKKLGFDRSGTGDVFFAVLAGSIINGESIINSTKKAADFVTRCIEYAEKLNLSWNYGLPFEEFLVDLK